MDAIAALAPASKLRQRIARTLLLDHAAQAHELGGAGTRAENDFDSAGSGRQLERLLRPPEQIELNKSALDWILLIPRGGRVGLAFCGMGITRRGWSGLRHLSRIVLVADARGRESRA
jgi:hypothetical protein